MSDKARQSETDSKQMVAVVGISCIFPGADSAQEFWNNLVDGTDSVSTAPMHRPDQLDRFKSMGVQDSVAPRGGFFQHDIPFSPQKYGILPNAVKRGDPDQFFMLRVVDEALIDAGIDAQSVLRQNTDLIVGNGGYTGQKLSELLLRTELIDGILELLEEEYPSSLAHQRSAIDSFLRSRLRPDDVETVSTCIPNIVASRAANRLNLGGAAYVVDAACASSLVAVEDAVLRLRTGRCDVAVAAGVFLKNCPTFRQVFDRLGALSPSGRICPMDESADGLVVGEGGGAVVLRRLEDAVRDRNEVYAIVRGIASSSDGRDVDVLAPSRSGQLQALSRAYDDAQVDPSTIGYLELHGTGTAVGDRVEAETVREFYGESEQPATARCVGSVKSMIGHTMPAAGIASFIKAVLSLTNKVLPPSLHCKTPRRELSGGQFFVNVETRPWVQAPEDGPRRAGVNTFGFGGINVHAVLEEVRGQGPEGLLERQLTAPATRPTELFCLSAANRQLLTKSVGSFLENVRTLPSTTRLGDLGYSVIADFDVQAPARLAIVAGTLDELESRLVQCQASLAAGEIPSSKDIFYGDESTRLEGKTAVVFPGIAWPGLSGAYPDHLRELCIHYPEVRAEFDAFEGRDRHPLDTTPTSAIFWPPALLSEDYKEKLKARLAPPRSDLAAQRKSDEHPEERYLAAMGVTMSNWVSWLLLRRLGVNVEMMIGQSQGEMAALCAAGSCDFQEMAPDFFKLVDIDWDVDEMDHCAFVWCPVDKLEQRIKDLDDLNIAIYISPDAQLIGGPHEQLKKLGNELRQEGHMYQIVPYSPIHTPAFTHLREKMNRVFSTGTGVFEPPQIPIYSAITEEVYPDEGMAIRHNLIRNLDEPVRMWQTLCRMYDDGARIFIQVGGGQIASSLDQLLPGRSGCLGVAMENEAVNPITQINRLCGQLVSVGISVDCIQLFERRGLELLDLECSDSKPEDSLTIPLRLDWHLFDQSVQSRRSSTSVTSDQQSEDRSRTAPQQASGVVSAATPDPDANGTGWPCTDHLPMAGRLSHFQADVECVTRRVLNLDEDLFLLDHLFANCEGLKPPSHCVPVLPMTFGIETIAEVASLLAPGRILVGLRNIRASQWIGMDDAKTLEIECHAQRNHEHCTDDRIAVDVTIRVEESVNLSGTAVFGRSRHTVESAPPVPDPHTDNELSAWPFTADQTYAEKILFHGPALQLVTRLGHNGHRVFTGELRVSDKSSLFSEHSQPYLLTDPALMDAVGQLVGLWAFAGGDYILPTGVEHIEMYQETPAPGTHVSLVCEATEFDRELKRCKFDVWVDDGEGQLWMHLSGWSDFLFGWSPNTSLWSQSPRHYILGKEIERPEDGASVLMSVSTRDIPRSITGRAARSALTLQEVEQMEQMEDARQQQRFLMSRVAAKDAARLWYVRFRPEVQIPHPVELQVDTDESGRPWLSEAGSIVEPWISIAHKGSIAVAVACGEEVGVDLEPARSIDLALTSEIASESEQQLFAAGGLDSDWLTRLWCAKEAVAKQQGTGLQGRPDQFIAVDVSHETGQFLMHIVASGETETVSTYEVDRMIIAVTMGRKVHAPAATAGYQA